MAEVQEPHELQSIFSEDCGSSSRVVWALASTSQTSLLGATKADLCLPLNLLNRLRKTKVLGLESACACSSSERLGRSQNNLFLSLLFNSSSHFICRIFWSFWQQIPGASLFCYRRFWFFADCDQTLLHWKERKSWWFRGSALARFGTTSLLSKYLSNHLRLAQTSPNIQISVCNIECKLKTPQGHNMLQDEVFDFGSLSCWKQKLWRCFCLKN